MQVSDLLEPLEQKLPNLCVPPGEFGIDSPEERRDHFIRKRHNSPGDRRHALSISRG